MKPNHFAACCMNKRGAVDGVVNGIESDGDFDVLEIRATESKRGHESRDWTVTTSIERKKGAAEGRYRSAGFLTATFTVQQAQYPAAAVPHKECLASL
ncbi:hypothetical protein MRX96_021455 [Rhipicephalus microplus]